MAASLIRALDDELSCPVCFEPFVDPNTPKNLPGCGHVLCEVCLNDMAAGKSRNIECPECRKPVIIPREGVAAFPTNFRLRNLAEKHQKVSDDKHDLGAGLTTKTEVIGVGEKDPRSNPPTGDRSCPEHAGELLDFYCATCSLAKCA